jgi:hypothetical protein
MMYAGDRRGAARGIAALPEVLAPLGRAVGEGMLAALAVATGLAAFVLFGLLLWVALLASVLPA